MDNHEVIYNIAKTILDDLEFWENNFDLPQRKIESIETLDGKIDPLSQIQKACRSADYQALRDPFQAYVKLIKNDHEHIIYFCNREDIAQAQLIETKDNVSYASYKAPLGRLAAKNVGDLGQFKFGLGFTFEILEKNIFRPKKVEKWDAVLNRIATKDGIVSVDSLLEYIKSIVDLLPSEVVDKDDFMKQFEKIEQEDYDEFIKKTNITKGYKREILEKVEFRNQAILDSVQDQIFRLPINSQIIVNGTAGTGKTTVILKRLAQKINYEFLTEEEITLIQQSNLLEIFNAQYRNWILFTPNSDIKNYIKETLNLEGIPASEKSLSTWENMRSNLARKFGVIKTGNSKGRFARSQSELFKSVLDENLKEISKLFRSYYLEKIQRRINLNKDWLISYKKMNVVQNKSLVRKILNILANTIADYDNDPDVAILNLVIKLSSLTDQYTQRKKLFNNYFRDETKTILFQNKAIYENILAYVKRLKPIDYNQIDIELDDENQEKYLNTILEDRYSEKIEIQTINMTKRAIAWHAEKFVDKTKKSNKNESYSYIINQLQRTSIRDDFFTRVGQNILEFRNLSIIVENYNILLNNIPRYYYSFRADQIKSETDIYDRSSFDLHKKRMISALEIDLILNEILLNSRNIFISKESLLLKEVKNSILEDIRNRLFLQVIVDEATDFSQIQINCMRYLTHPLTDSIILSGDIMQRIQLSGLPDWDVFIKEYPEFQFNSLKNVYRQSHLMLEVAKQIFEQSTKKKPDFKSIYTSNSQDPPPLKFMYSNKDDLCNWVISRINEIYTTYNRLPAIALFVPNEKQIDLLYEILYDRAYEFGYDLEKCPEGKIGDINKIKIYSIEYIKGMEFEAVFIVDIDKIAQNKPEIIDKILYVGLTRAASHLAVLYSDSFPKEINYVEDKFSDDNWII